jgi:hypothetical protein
LTPRKVSTFPRPGHFHVSAGEARARGSRTEQQSALASARDSHFVPSHHGRCSWPGYPAWRRWFQTCGAAGALSYLLAGTRQDATACPGGGVSPITTDMPGEWWQPAARLRARRSGSDCCAGVGSLRMSARRHVLEAQPGPTAAKLLPRRRTTTVTWRQAWNIGPDDGRPWTILDGLPMPTDLMVRRPSWRLPPCPPRARKEGHLRRFTVSHGATGSALDLCSRRSSGCGHYLCKQGVRGSSLSSSTRQNVSGKDHPLPV